jgi:hypothetical protein
MSACKGHQTRNVWRRRIFNPQARTQGTLRDPPEEEIPAAFPPLILVFKQGDLFGVRIRHRLADMFIFAPLLPIFVLCHSSTVSCLNENMGRLCRSIRRR